MHSIPTPPRAEPGALRQLGALASFGVGMLLLMALALPGQAGDQAYAQACPPYCETPVITPAWHLHMCDEPYQEQLDDNHCMIRSGPRRDRVPIRNRSCCTSSIATICRKRSGNIVKVQVKDSGGGLQYINHPDGITYVGGMDARHSSSRSARGSLPAASPYYTSAEWPEGPFSGRWRRHRVVRRALRRV